MKVVSRGLSGFSLSHDLLVHSIYSGTSLENFPGRSPSHPILLFSDCGEGRAALLIYVARCQRFPCERAPLAER